MLANSFTINGDFALTVNGNGLNVHIDGTMPIWFGAMSLAIDADAEIVGGANPGLVVYADASLAPGSFFGIGLANNPIFNFDVNFHLEINTISGSGSDVVNGHAVPRSSFEVAIDGDVKLFGGIITLNGSGDIKVQNGVFRVDIDMSAELTPLLTLHADGFFSSDGQFAINLNGQLSLGVDGVGLYGNASLTISYLNVANAQGVLVKTLEVHGHVDASLQINIGAIHITLFGVGLDVDYSSSTGEFGVTADINIIGLHIRPHFTIGHLMTPPPPMLATPVNGVLQLNVGTSRSQYRNVGQGQQDETYTISQKGTIISITGFGVTESYDTQIGHITSISGDFTGDGANTVTIGSGVSEPGYAHGRKNVTVTDTGTGALTLNSGGSSLINAIAGQAWRSLRAQRRSHVTGSTSTGGHAIHRGRQRLEHRRQWRDRRCQHHRERRQFGCAGNLRGRHHHNQCQCSRHGHGPRRRRRRHDHRQRLRQRPDR